MEDPKQNRKICSADGCTNQAQLVIDMGRKGEISVVGMNAPA